VSSSIPWLPAGSAPPHPGGTSGPAAQTPWPARWTRRGSAVARAPRSQGTPPRAMGLPALGVGGGDKPRSGKDRPCSMLCKSELL
jgi:hypothetical protein